MGAGESESPSRGTWGGSPASEGSPAQAAHTAFAQGLFNGIAASYDSWAQPLTFFRYLGWREFLVSRMRLRPDDLVLDASTGTAGVALEIARQHGGKIVGLDITRLMLEGGLQAINRRNMDGRIQLVQGSAERLPFPDETFDAVVSSYLYRYVEDLGATIGELSRVLKPGGQLLSLEFGVPGERFPQALWLAYTRGILPLVTIPAPGGWRAAGRFLGPSIARLCRRYPVSAIAQLWNGHGFPAVEIKHLLWGAAVVMWGQKVPD